MQVRILSALAILVFLNCSAVKYNNHVASDGANGYLRTYYSSAKSSSKRTEGTGIEQCKPQGSDVVCKDLNVIHAEDEFGPKPAPVQPQPVVSQPVVPPQPVAPQPAKPAVPAQPAAAKPAKK